MLPLTFKMEPAMAIAVLMGIYIGGVSGGFIGSILLGIPGTTNSIATVFDGYEMTKKGEAVRALVGGCGGKLSRYGAVYFNCPVCVQLDLQVGGKVGTVGVFFL